MNQHELSWAVQYEITRFRSQSADYCFTTEEYARIFPDLRGTNDTARHVIHLLRTLVRGRRENIMRSPELQMHLDAVKRRVAELERTEKDAYVELDHEEDAIKAGKGAGLGFTSHGPDPDWYGGQGTQNYSISLFWASAHALFSHTRCRFGRTFKERRLHYEQAVLFRIYDSAPEAQDRPIEPCTT